MVKFVVKSVVKIVVKLKNCWIGTKIGVVKYKKQKTLKKNTDPLDSRTRGPAAPSVLVIYIFKLFFGFSTLLLPYAV